MLLDTVPWMWGHYVPQPVHGYSSNSSFWDFWWLCTPPQTSSIQKMAKYHTSWYLHPRSFWVRICLRTQNLWSCLSGWLGCPLSTFFNVSEPNPRFNVPTYLIHVDRGAHVTYHDKAHCNILHIKASQTSEDASNQCYPWQKVLGIPNALPPSFFLFVFIHQ